MTFFVQIHAQMKICVEYAGKLHENLGPYYNVQSA